MSIDCYFGGGFNATLRDAEGLLSSINIRVVSFKEMVL